MLSQIQYFPILWEGMDQIVQICVQVNNTTDTIEGWIKNMIIHKNMITHRENMIIHKEIIILIIYVEIWKHILNILSVSSFVFEPVAFLHYQFLMTLDRTETLAHLHYVQNLEDVQWV